MALNSVYTGQLDKFLEGLQSGTAISPSSLDQIRGYLSTLKSNGVSDDDLKPYLDKFTAAGYNIGPDYSLTKNTQSNQGGTYTPASPPAPKEVIPGTNIDTSSDRGQIEQEAAREKQQLLDANQQAADLRSKGLGSLGDILLRQNQAQFNYDLPGIKEDLANSGLFSSPSALASAVARESGMLGANTAAQLGQAGVGNINLQAEGLLGANQNSIGLQQGGLQRQFSVSDYDKQAALAREIGAMSVPNAPSPFAGIASGAASGATAGAAFGPGGAGYGAVAGGGLALLNNLTSGGRGGGGTFLCTHLKNMGYMTKEEVKAVHDKIFTKSFCHYYSFAVYCLLAPMFIVRTSLGDFPWWNLKKYLCDDILACETSEEAFQKYKSVCIEIMRPVFPKMIRFFFGKETAHGYRLSI